MSDAPVMDSRPRGVAVLPWAHKAQPTCVRRYGAADVHSSSHSSADRVPVRSIPTSAVRSDGNTRTKLAFGIDVSVSCVCAHAALSWLALGPLLPLYVAVFRICNSLSLSLSLSLFHSRHLHELAFDSAKPEQFASFQSQRC
jgi:hypothetical protein